MQEIIPAGKQVAMISRELKDMADFESLRAFANATVLYWHSTDDLDDFHYAGKELFLTYGLLEEGSEGLVKTRVLLETSK